MKGDLPKNGQRAAAQATGAVAPGHCRRGLHHLSGRQVTLAPLQWSRPRVSAGDSTGRDQWLLSAFLPTDISQPPLSGSAGLGPCVDGSGETRMLPVPPPGSTGLGPWTAAERKIKQTLGANTCLGWVRLPEPDEQLRIKISNLKPKPPLPWNLTHNHPEFVIPPADEEMRPGLRGQETATSSRPHSRSSARVDVS